MRRGIRVHLTLVSLWLTLLSVLLPPQPAFADVAPKWTDSQLIRFSDVILRGRVARVGVGVDPRLRTPYTYVMLEVSDVLKGAVSDRRVTIKQLGGRVGSTALQIAGQPTFADGEDVLLFLEVRPRDRTLTTTAQWQGKFTIQRQTPTAVPVVAVREDPSQLSRRIFGSEVRALPQWVAELQRQIAAAGPTPPSVPAAAPGDIDIAPREAAALLPNTGRNVTSRVWWRQSPGDRSGMRVDMMAPGPVSTADGGDMALRRAADLWTDTGMTRLSPGGLQSSGCFLSQAPDGRISVGADACEELSPRGGTIALTGTWVEFGNDRVSAPGDGRLVGAGVITNRGNAAARVLARPSCLDSVLTHELGHAIGLSHTTDRSSPMAQFLRCDTGFGTIVSPETDRRDHRASMVAAPMALQPRLTPLDPARDTAADTTGIVRISVPSDGSQPNGASDSPSLSADGRFVAFNSTASNLVAGDTNGWSDIFVYDRTTGVVTRESVGVGGAQANDGSYYPAISSTGRFIAFQSYASSLVAGASGGQIFVRDRQLGQTLVASVSSTGVPTGGSHDGPSISADGRFVSFSSYATTMVPGDTNQAPDIFTRDLIAGTTTRDSVTSTGAQGSFGSSVDPSISSDGRYVAFVSNAFLTTGNTGGIDVFIHDRQTGQTTLESVGTSGTQLTGDSVSISGDGQVVAFVRRVPSLSELYIRDRLSGQTVGILSAPTISSHPRFSADGRYLSYGRSGVGEVLDRLTGQFASVATATSVTPLAGNVVAFASLAPVVPGDTNGLSDIFVGTVSFASAGTPGPPLNLTYSISGSTLTLRWTAPATGAPPTAYVIDAGSTSGSVDLVSFSTGSTATTFSAIVSSGTYFVRVRASNASGTSGPSNEVAITIGSVSQLPGPPTGLTATATGSTVTLTWNAPTTGGAATSYIIEAGSAPGEADLAEFSTGNAATTFTASGVGGGVYYVRVRAANVAGSGAPSNTAVLVVGSTCAAPGAPSGLSAAVAGSTVTLSWTAGSGAASYLLSAGSGPGQTDVLVTDLGSAATSLTAVGVSPGTYFVHLRSLNACGQSGPSNEVAIIVQ